ncbi:MAG: energy transducer TonB [Pyrinomonadaceae bacterium]
MDETTWIPDATAVLYRSGSKAVVRGLTSFHIPFFPKLVEGPHTFIVSKPGYRSAKHFYRLDCDCADDNGLVWAEFTLNHGNSDAPAEVAPQKFTMKGPDSDSNTCSNPQPLRLPNLQKTISGGVLNGKAISFPQPPYPPTARNVRAAGPVSVQVLIDVEGNVISANAVSGHPLLRSAAEVAARGAKFSPTLVDGVPVKVSGVITYNFVP